MGSVEGKVAFITGAARGQGRSNAVRLAQEGADILAVDICANVESVPYALASPEDMKETVAAVEGLGRRIDVHQVDVRDAVALQRAFDEGAAQLGPVDIVVANAGIAPMATEEHPHAWRDVIDINLTGTLNTVEVAVPAMVAQGGGGAIVLISSTAGLKGLGGSSRGGLGYGAAKHGIVGLMRNYANNLAPHSIRVNSVHPTGVRTPMGLSESLAGWLTTEPALMHQMANPMPVELVEPEDIANAVLWLVSDAARYVTGATIPVDAGFNNKI